MASGWTCPECGRWFGRRRAHICAPPMTVDGWFDGRPAELRGIYDAVAKHLRKLGPVMIEPVSVGFLIKRMRTIAELRPRKAGFTLSFVVRREIRDERITRKIAISGDQVCHFAVLTRRAEVDATVRGWLSEAYASGEAPRER